MAVDIGLWQRPRWGVGSVRLHLDVEDLALALLLFDRVVLPKPDGPDEEKQWKKSNWDPERQAVLGVSLDPLIHYVEWNKDLRQRWAERMNKLEPIAQEVEGLGYSITTQVISLSAWNTAIADQDHGLVGKPVPFAWCPRTAAELARRGIDTAVHDEPEAAPIDIFEPEYGTTTGPADFSSLDHDQAKDCQPVESLILSRQMTIPTSSASDPPEVVLENVYDLVTDPEFVTARAHMYAYLAGMAAGAIPQGEIVERLQIASAAYDDKVAKYNQAGVRRTIHQVVPMAANYGPKLFGLSFPGVGWIARKVLARFDPLPPHPAAHEEPAAALAMARRVLPRVHTDISTTLAAAAVHTANYRSQNPHPA